MARATTKWSYRSGIANKTLLKNAMLQDCSIERPGGRSQIELPLWRTNEKTSPKNKFLQSNIIEHLKAVVDPGMKFNIVDLGLVYEVNVDNESNNVEVRMTLTSPGCPYGQEIFSAVDMVLQTLGFHEKKVNLVWDPPWDPATMASEEVKDAMGIW